MFPVRQADTITLANIRTELVRRVKEDEPTFADGEEVSDFFLGTWRYNIETMRRAGLRHDLRASRLLAKAKRQLQMV